MEKTPLVNIFVMGKKYAVPDSLTIMDAMEYAGYQLKRGCGCRAGFCGACGTVFRLAGEYDLKVGLACQTKVEPDMYLAQLPFFPGRKAVYDIEKLEPTVEPFLSLYPEIFRCLGCNSCTKVCPQDLNVMQYVACLQRGDLKRAADLSFDCLMCGLCVSRCPVNIVHYNAAILARRLSGRHTAPPSSHLQARIKEVAGGKFDEDISELMNHDTNTLKELYHQREME